MNTYERYVELRQEATDLENKMNLALEEYQTRLKLYEEAQDKAMEKVPYIKIGDLHFLGFEGGMIANIENNHAEQELSLEQLTELVNQLIYQGLVKINDLTMKVKEVSK